MNCPEKYLQVEKDLLPFNQINLEELAKEAVGRFGTHHAICHYSVINNQVCNTVQGSFLWDYEIIASSRIPVVTGQIKF